MIDKCHFRVLLEEKVDNNIKATSDQLDDIKSKILEVKTIVENLSFVFVKNGGGLIARYKRADFEMNLFNEINQRPKIGDVKKLIEDSQALINQEIEKAPAKKINKIAAMLKDFATILNFIILMALIFLFFLK